MESWIVYKHTSPSEKVYIGITKRNSLDRWNSGKGYKDCPKFYKAILKYGWNNIKHEIIHENLSKEEACEFEKYYIALYKKEGKSYNITDGGEGLSGVRRFGEENPFFGKQHNSTTKTKISSAQQGENNNMFGSKAPCAIKINGKYLTEYAAEANTPYKKFYLYFIRHNRDIDKTINYYKRKSKTQ